MSRIIFLISWGLGVCDCVSRIRWQGLDPGRPAPVVMGAWHSRAAPVRERLIKVAHTAMPRHSSGTTERAWSAPLLARIWELASSYRNGKIRGQEGCGAGHHGILFRCKTAFDRQPSLRREKTAHMGCLLVRGTLPVLLSLRCTCPNIPCTAR